VAFAPKRLPCTVENSEPVGFGGGALNIDGVDVMFPKSDGFFSSSFLSAFGIG
jgi:hypothetical protein